MPGRMVTAHLAISQLLTLLTESLDNDPLKTGLERFSKWRGKAGPIGSCGNDVVPSNDPGTLNITHRPQSRCRGKLLKNIPPVIKSPRWINGNVGSMFQVSFQNKPNNTIN